MYVCARPDICYLTQLLYISSGRWNDWIIKCLKSVTKSYESTRAAFAHFRTREFRRSCVYFSAGFFEFKRDARVHAPSSRRRAERDARDVARRIVAPIIFR